MTIRHLLDSLVTDDDWEHRRAQRASIRWAQLDEALDDLSEAIAGVRPTRTQAQDEATLEAVRAVRGVQ